jgi:alpha-glucosidase
MNGPDPRSVTIPLAFLGNGKYEALLVRDRMENPAALTLERSTVTKGNGLTIEMRAGGGFIGRFA